MRALSMIAVLTAGCGGGRRIVETEEAAQEPAWARDYAALVRAACECKDAPCIREKRPVLEGMVAKHGGLDDAPASVHEGKAKLEVCWKEIARDLALDLEEPATTICECSDSLCARSYREQLAAIVARGSRPDQQLRGEADDQRR